MFYVRRYYTLNIDVNDVILVIIPNYLVVLTVY